jgi:hypothetical protein
MAFGRDAIECFLRRCHGVPPLMIYPSAMMRAHRLQTVKAVSRMLGDRSGGLFTSG